MPISRPAQVELVLRRPGYPERRMLLSPGITQIGRAEDNDIVLSDVGVSRRHARIQVGEAEVRITDIGSGNGIFYRGSRIREQDLINGDEVLVDPFVLTFHIRRTEPNRSSDDPDTAPIKRRHIQPDRAPPAARLVVLTGHRLASSYNLGERGLTLGRSEQRDIVLFDPAASRLHVDIRAEADSYWVRDKGSANGTFLNGKRIREQPLGHGDRLRVGGTEFRFEVLREGLDLETTVSDVGLQAAAGHVLTPPPLPIEGPTIPLDLSSRHHQDWEPAPSLTRDREPVGLGAWSLLASATLLALGALSFTIWLAWQGQNVPTSGPTEPSWASESPQVRDLVEASELALDGGAYMEAATHAYRALKLAPRHRAAQRNGYIACERAVLERLRTRLWVRTRSDEERASHREEALAISKEAMSSGEPEELELAREALEQGLRLIPGDRSLERALTRIEGATGTP